MKEGKRGRRMGEEASRTKGVERARGQRHLSLAFLFLFFSPQKENLDGENILQRKFKFEISTPSLFHFVRLPFSPPSLRFFPSSKLYPKIRLFYVIQRLGTVRTQNLALNSIVNSNHFKSFPLKLHKYTYSFCQFIYRHCKKYNTEKLSIL